MRTNRRASLDDNRDEVAGPSRHVAQRVASNESSPPDHVQEEPRNDGNTQGPTASRTVTNPAKPQEGNQSGVSRARTRRRPPVRPDRMRVDVDPAYSARHSAPPDQYVFTYFVRIENIGKAPAQLFWRQLLFHDSVAGNQEVEGEGVVGESPLLEPGDVHEYESFCMLEDQNGYMEGYYHFRENDGSVFRAELPRCLLRTPPGALSILGPEAEEPS